ncbi:hypothetical protein EC988_002336 [Linderina pennispora]|nr:hypothetical protein EC988_002336 [Linderina pennispora]
MNAIRNVEVDPKTPKHRFLHSKVDSVNDNNTLSLSNGRTVPFDYLILATGSSAMAPIKAQKCTRDEILEDLAKLSKSIEAATSILIIGGGPVGVETAGEIANMYPEKGITLVNNRMRLLPDSFKNSLSVRAINRLQDIGVNIVLDEKILIPHDFEFDCEVKHTVLKGTSGAIYESDLQIMATGVRPQSSYIAALESATGVRFRDINGAIKVRDTMQVDCNIFPNIFAPGDVNSLPPEHKFSFKAQAQANIAVANIDILIKAGWDVNKVARSSAGLRRYTDSFNGILVPISKADGVAQVSSFVIPKCLQKTVVSNTKGKDYFAAKAASKSYPNLHITVIDKSTHFYHCVGSPRAVVQPEFGKLLIHPISNAVKSAEIDPKNPKHRFIHAKVNNINDNNTLLLSNGSIIAFDYLVLATGSAAMKPIKADKATGEEILEDLSKFNEAIKKAGSILIIGGGSVGVETAGEIAAAYPDKSITLVNSQNRLLPENFSMKLSTQAISGLRSAGVNVVLNEKILLPGNFIFDGQAKTTELSGASGAIYKSDFQIMATGVRPQADYLAGLEATSGISLRENSGAVKVRESIQLDSDKFPNIFVPGDANNLPPQNKYLFKAQAQANVAVANIEALIKEGWDTNKEIMPKVAAKKYSDPINATLVPISRTTGVVQLSSFTLPGFLANIMVKNTKGKDYFAAKAAEAYPVTA